jgi:SHS2 domain-containing protein
MSMGRYNEMGYELLDHTGDLGIRVWADDVKGLFQQAALALFDIITDLETIEVHLSREVSVQGAGQEELLVAWLNELLYLHEVEELLFCAFDLFDLGAESVHGVAKGERFRQGRHRIKTAVKAVTYHQLEIKEQDKRWQAQVIFDI